ncbi:MAG: response regulator transcription factor [Spirochaetales bacterium]
MYNILIVDDEKNIVNVLKEYAKYYGFLADTASDGLEALEKVNEKNFDCMIIDIMMPNLNGYDTVKAMKKIKNIPVIMISAKGEEYDKLHGFELGIDDYIVKPFSPKEVMARIKAVLKRTNGFVDYAEIDDLKIDLNGRKVFVKDELIQLTKKEYDLLLYLLNNKGVVLSREQLINTVWGYDYYGYDRTLDTHIKMLRAHLKECGKYIKTIRGFGYKFEEN